jgi:hypothetical protein
MSVPGHSRRFDRITATSVLPRTDILWIGGPVSKVPKPEVSSLGLTKDQFWPLG